MRNTFIIFLLVSLLTFENHALASNDALFEQSAQKELIQKLKHQLSLVDDQVEPLVRVLSATNKRRDSVLKRFGITFSNDRKVRLSLREKLSLKKEMEKIKYQSDDEISDILNEKQMLLWSKFQSTKQNEFKQKLLSKIN